ncbi:MAG: PAS domain S-box protein, partial [Deltaproteobacteria bacterium]|nr:PAS domain S-box protein [Deltaproteobacteria bacterium]
AERERLLEEVRRHAAELDATITSIPDGVIICGAEGEIVRLNDSARRILGLSPEQLALPLTERMRLLEAETPDGRPVPADQAPLFRALAGETVRGVVMVLRPRGPRCTRVSMSAAPIRTPDGTQRGAVAVLNDVTTLHEMEEQREDILRAVSHDLRTPLVSVGGFARLLLRQREQAGAPEPELGHLRHILAGARQMNALIQDLVDSVRIEAGQVRLNPQPVALREFIAEVLGRAAGALETERIQIDLAPGIPPVLADSSSLERVLLNLLSNALKYSPPGSPVVLAATSGGAKATVSVSDQGPGIVPEDLPRLFERFFRTTLGRQADGIGLGLHITKTLVECQGGRLWVDSRPGEGTTFTLTLPLA